MLIPFWKKLLGFVFYMLPWKDAFPLGIYLFSSFPFLINLKIPTYPVESIERIIPFGFGNIFIFLIIFFGIVRNERLDRFLRFHALQSILINLLIIISIYFYKALIYSTLLQIISEMFASLIFLGALLLIIISSIKCFQGQETDIPWISEAVRMQL